MKEDNKPIVAIMYDFDRTLSTKEMQEYQFIPLVGMTADEFWNAANSLAVREEMDNILAYMYFMIKKSAECGIPMKRDNFVKLGNSIEFFNGVQTWFDRINRFGESQGVTIEHYVISSGLREIIEGTSISGYFKNIFACEFLYDNNGDAVWAKTAVNYTAKTQFIYRINKGVHEVYNDYDLNRSTPDENRRVPFTNMIYIGDGMSDVPCMKSVKSYGGYAIAVYQKETKARVAELLKRRRVDFLHYADYSEDSELEITVKNIIKRMSVSSLLHSVSQKQSKEIENQ